MKAKGIVRAALLKRLDVAAVIEDLTNAPATGANIHCLFPDDHEGGDDSTSSLHIDAATGKAFCHGCGHRASGIIGLYQDIKQLDHDAALVQMWHEYVEKIVPEAEVRKAHRELLANPLIMMRLKKRRGLTEATIKEFRLGWRGDRLWIPVENEVGLVVDIRKYDLMKRAEPGKKVLSYKSGYGKARLYPSKAMSSLNKSVLLMEGEMDTLLARQNGSNAVTITSGALTMPLPLARKFKRKKVTVVADNDRAGKKGAKKRADSVASAGAKSSRVVHLPVQKVGEDYTDWIIKYQGDPSEIFNYVVSRQNGLAAAEEDEDDDGSDGAENIQSPDRDREMAERAQIVLDVMKKRGGFFSDGGGHLYYVPKDARASVMLSDSDALFGYLSSHVHATINPATTLGRFTGNHIRFHAKACAKPVTTGAWSHFKSPGTLYLYSSRDEIIKADRRGVRTIKNALSDDRILLETDPSRALSGVKWKPDTDISDAIKYLWRYVARNIAISNSDRYIIVCWMIGCLFREMIRSKPLLRFVAGTSRGKSTACKLISHLFYGEEVLNSSSTTDASRYTIARTNPLLIFDNIETRNMNPAFEDFMLEAATGGAKTKRAANTDSGIIVEKINCLILTNGIEPFARNELISRTLEIEVDAERYGRPNFQEFLALRDVVKHRDAIWSGILKMCKKHVFHRIEEGDVGRIGREFGRHAMERFNDYVSLMAIIADGVYAYHPTDLWPDTRLLVGNWLESQEDSAVSRRETTNDVLYWLSTFVERRHLTDNISIRMAEKNGRVVFKCTTRQLLSDLRVLCRTMGQPCPWKSERQLGVRIADAEAILISDGWKRRSCILSGRQNYEYTAPKGTK